MAKAWVVDLWVKDATEITPTGERVKVPAPANQLKSLGQLEDRFKTTKFGQGMRWSARWLEDKDGVSRERSKSFKLVRDANAFVAEMEDDIRSGRYRAPEDALQRFRDVGELWLESKKRPKEVTLRRYARELRMYVNPQWGSVQIGSISRKQIDKWVAALQDGTAPRVYTRNIEPGKLSPGSIEHIVGVVFGGVIRYAVSSGWLPSNPMANVELPRTQDAGEDLLTLNHVEVRCLANAAYKVDQRESDRALIYFLAYTGLRINEALAIKKSDVNLKTRRVRVLRTWTEDIDGKRILGPPKTWEKRTVPLPRFIAALLKDLLEGQDLDAYLFRAKRGGFVHDHNWRNRIWTKAVVGAGLKESGLTIHKLRHTAASAAIAAGADVKIVQLMLGHKDATETLNTYGHLWPDRLDEVVDAVDAARVEALREAA